MEFLADLIQSPLDIWVSLGLIAISALASFITAAFGIGGGGILLAAMASLVPIGALIPVHGLVQVGSNVGRLWMFRRHVIMAYLPAFAIGTVIGAACAGLVVVELPADFVRIGVGVFIIWSVALKPPAWLRRWGWLTGFVSSFLSIFFGATGLFVASYVKALNLPRHAHVAAQAALMSMQHLMKVVVFGLLGFAFGEWVILILLMILSGLVGTWIGKKVLNRMDESWFRIMLNAILVLLSLRLIWTGVAGMLG